MFYEFMLLYECFYIPSIQYMHEGSYILTLFFMFSATHFYHFILCILIQNFPSVDSPITL